MVLIYWVMALPYRVGIGSAWIVGIILDVLEGSVLGLNALGLVVIAYVTLNLHQRLRMFSALQQAGLVLALVGINLVFGHWLQIVTGQTVSSSVNVSHGSVNQCSNLAFTLSVATANPA